MLRCEALKLERRQIGWGGGGCGRRGRTGEGKIRYWQGGGERWGMDGKGQEVSSGLAKEGWRRIAEIIYAE